MNWFGGSASTVPEYRKALIGMVRTRVKKLLRKSRRARKSVGRWIYAIPGAPRVLNPVVVPTRLWLIRLKCYIADIRIDRKHLRWPPARTSYWQLSSELVFYAHKLEKGLSLPKSARAFFGVDAANKTLHLLDRWDEAGLATDGAVYKGVIGVLDAYARHLTAISNEEPAARALAARIAPYLRDHPTEPAFLTPLAQKRVPDDAYAALQALALARRSTRDYAQRAVPKDMVEKAIEVAQLSPSACNRQPWKVHLYDDPDKIKALLALQNGNRGFGETIPLLAVIASDLTSFFDSTERIEPVLDGGLFLMSFLLALQAQGLSSCCLNWLVPPETDRRGHVVGGIPEQEKILTFLAIGFADPDSVVPLSARRPVSDVIQWH